MGILFTLLLIVTPCTGIYLFVRSGRKSQKNEAFLNKYSVLIKLLTHKRNTKILKVRSTSISVLVKIKKDQHFLSLAEVDDRLIIVWKLQSPRFGKRGKEWSFNPAYSQSRMYDEILTDVRNYQADLRTERGAFENDLSPA